MLREMSSIARARSVDRLIRELHLADGPCLSLIVPAASLRPSMCPKDNSRGPEEAFGRCEWTQRAWEWWVLS